MKNEQTLINETRDLIDAVRAGHPATADAGKDQSTSGSIDERDMIVRAGEDQVDGCATVVISKDKMTASISLYPPQGFGRVLEPDDIHERLHEAGVVYGICNDGVEEALFTCNTDRVALYSVEVAYGLPPQPKVPEYIRLLETAEEDSGEPPTAASNEPVDHRLRCTIPLVEAGSTVAVVEPETPGHDGTTVTGTTIPQEVRTPSSIELGENVEITDGNVVAVIPGMLHLEDGKISVEPTLPLSKGVGYHTGNIEFDGDVVLNDRIADGFTVACTGTLAAAVTIDAFGISCGTLTGVKGLIGHGDTLVNVASDASLRFIQNARMHVGGTLRIAHSMLTSHVTAYDRVELAHGSSVVTSTIRAGLGAEVFNIGTASAGASEIYLGIDFKVDERLATIRDQTLALSAKLRDVRRALARGGGAPGLVSLENDLKAAIAGLANEAGELVSHLDRDEDASLVVHGAIHPGTYIEICHRSLVVERSMSRCTFRLDRKTGKIEVKPLGTSTRGK